MKKIGKCNGGDVLYADHVLRIRNTSIVIYGIKNEQDAKESAKKNFKGFEEV